VLGDLDQILCAIFDLQIHPKALVCWLSAWTASRAALKPWKGEAVVVGPSEELAELPPAATTAGSSLLEELR
jgi:hypothetical protein